MFRWLALCLVLCGAAFALVAMATGAFNPQQPMGSVEPPRFTDPANAPEETVKAAAPGLGLGLTGGVFIKDARLTAIEREEVPSQHDGTMLVVGTDEPAGPGETAEALPPIRVPFLALLLDPKDPKNPVDAKDLPPESQWLFLIKAADSKFREAVGQARLGKLWDDYKKAPNYQVFRRWQEGDPLEPGKVEMAFEQKVFRKLREGEWVKKDQLLALVDTTTQAYDVSSKVRKLESAEAEFLEAIKTKEEAIRRASSAEFLWSKGKGYISEDDYKAALLNRDRYIQEQEVKDAARRVSGEELSASLSILKLHEIRASIPGVVKVIYRHKGESVKNLDPVVQIQNPLKLRVEGLADVQDAQNLAIGLPVIVEPTRPVRPVVLPGHQSEVTCVAVSRAGANGGKLIVSGSEDGTLRFWDWTAKQPQVALLDHLAGVVAVACTGPGAGRNLALSGDRNGVGRLIDLDHLLPTPAAEGQPPPAPQQPVKLEERHKGPITCVAFSPDGTVCATGGEDRAIRLWDPNDGKLLATCFFNGVQAAHKAAVTSLQFAQEQDKPLRLVSAGGDNTLIVWNLKDVKKPQPADVLPYRSGDVTKLGVSADGKHVLFDHGPELRVLSLDDTKQIEGVIRNTTNFTTMALFAPDGNTVLTNSASEGRLQLWRAPGRGADAGDDHCAELRQFVGGGPATCGAFDPDSGFAVTGSRDNDVLVWAMPKAAEVLAKPRETRLTLVERALDNGARQVRVWAELTNDDYAKETGLTPGGTATMVVPPAKPEGK